MTNDSIHSNVLEIGQLNLEPGDLVEFDRSLNIRHFAVYEDYKTVYHVKLSQKSKFCLKQIAEVCVETFEEVAMGCPFRKANKMDSEFIIRPVDEIFKTAKSLLGKRPYHLLSYNCEHFANFCRYGLPWSMQVLALKHWIPQFVFEWLRLSDNEISKMPETKQFLEIEPES